MRSRAVILFLLLGAAVPAFAIGDAGQVLFVAGNVTAERTAAATSLKQGDSIQEADIIATAARSRGQLLMRDGAKFALRPDTRFVVEEYYLAGDQRVQTDGSVVVASQDSAVTALIKGGFRTITGTIGQNNPDSYRVETPGATMGIRGTHYSVVWCAGDCELPPGVRRADPIPDGLYIGVSDGIVVIKNLTGEYTLRTGEFAYVKDRNSRPVRLPERPVVLIDTYPTQTVSVVDEDDWTTTAEETDPKLRPGPPRKRPPRRPPPPGGPEPPEPPVPPVPCCRVVALAGGPIPDLSAAAFTGSSRLGLRSLAGRDLLEFQSAPTTGNSSYAIGTASNFDQGFDPLTGIGWGRWSDGLAAVTQFDGSVITADLTNQSLHWINGPDIASTPAIPLSGTANFTLIAGNTNPTDTLGNTGVLGRSSLVANFTTGTVESMVSLAIDGSFWEASGSGAITTDLFSGLYDTVSIGGVAGGSGNFAGFFGATGVSGFPAGAGLTYGLTDGLGLSVSGAIVFVEPSL